MNRNTTAIGVIAALVGLLAVLASNLHAQDDEQIFPWNAQAQQDATQPESKTIPTLSDLYEGDIEFLHVKDSAALDLDQSGGALSGDWSLEDIDMGPFIGSVTAKGKVKLSLTFEIGGPSCVIKLSGSLHDGVEIISGSAKFSNCGKQGKKDGTGSFKLED